MKIVRAPGVRSGVWLLLLAMALVGVAVVMVALPIVDPRPAKQPARQAAKQAASHPVPQPRARSHELRPRPPVAAGSAAGTEHPANSEPNTTEDEAPNEAEPAQEKAGIAVFPPPGTEPLRRGIVVPDDFELPPGYVRHFQVTDHGEQLPAILMFHPDYAPVDDRGEPIALPKDRIVPPEMAPAGMPVHVMEPPDDRVPVMEDSEERAGQEPES